VARALPIAAFAPEHATAAVEVIAAVFAEYGMTFDLPGFDADLLDIAAHYESPDGWFAVLLDDGNVVGTVALRIHDDEAELKRLYLLPKYRGQGHGAALLRHAESRARGAACRTLIAWSDTRLETAHQVYLHCGFEPIGDRVLDDLDQSHELGFRKQLK
jgi:GNAT superfamily N-acetyltransferase